MTNSFTTSGLFGSLLSNAKTASVFSAPAFTQRMLDFEVAWTLALRDSGVVQPSDAELALAAIRRLPDTDVGAGSDRDGVPVPVLVAAMKKGLSPGAAAAIHTGATSRHYSCALPLLPALKSGLKVLVARSTYAQRAKEELQPALTKLECG